MYTIYTAIGSTLFWLVIFLRLTSSHLTFSVGKNCTTDMINTKKMHLIVSRIIKFSEQYTAAFSHRRILITYLKSSSYIYVRTFTKKSTSPHLKTFLVKIGFQINGLRLKQ